MVFHAGHGRYLASDSKIYRAKGLEEGLRSDYTPRLVGVSIIADDLGSNHEGGYEQAVSGGTARDGEPCLQSL